MTRETSESIQESITNLKEKYIARLSARLDEIKELTLSLLEHPSPIKALESIKLHFHNIAGSSGSFGFKSLGDYCKQAELKCAELISLRPIKVSENQVTSLLTYWEQAGELMRQEKEEAAIHFCSSILNPKRELNSIWIIDDDVLLSNELQRQFESFGFNVRVFNQLESANQAARSDSPDTILLDVMFDEGHLNATEELGDCKNLLELNVPIVFMSAYDHFDSRVRSVKLNAKGYFLKPLVVPNVVNYLRSLFDRHNIPKAKVLIVDDDQLLASRIKIILNAAGFEAHCLNEPQSIIEEIDRLNVQLVIMDLHMPDYNGIELAGVIRQYERWLKLPIIFLSSETDPELQAKALAQGAEDFLNKPINDLQLINIVRAKVQRSRLLEEDVVQDNFTGLLKHSVIKEAIEREVLLCQRKKEPCTILVLDIDELNTVNTKYGNEAGNLVITSLSNLLKQSFRQTDFIGRYGGEEFALVLPGCDSKKSMLIANTIRESFQSIKFTSDDASFHCTLSGGMCNIEDFEGIDGQNALASASTALNHAKCHGRNQIVDASEIMTSFVY